MSAKKSTIKIRKPTAKGSIVFKNKKREAKANKSGRKLKHKDGNEH